ncbi:MAG TPA: DegT/DnrJ/EryC1/StrS family aminotransferase [Vulgatibacter sp.]|nr:DegT/DnrJ/EryC1/StrS family aminotransferase [Vulgatibacter sp.]
MNKILLSPPHMGPEERDLLVAAFDSNWIAPLGEHVDRFESELASVVGGGHIAALSSGTGAIHLALTILGVGAEDDVLVSSLTFAASANPVCYLGARPSFVDAERTSWNLDPILLAEELETRAKGGKLPKAVIVVDLYGHPADFDRIRAVCAQYEIPIVEDAAEALGSTYKGRAAGTLGDLGIFSFNGNKIITTSGGGALWSAHKEWIDRARYLSTQARDPAPYYQHSATGFNYRLSNLLAAVGRGQLRVLHDRVAARRANFAYYYEHLGHLPGIDFMPEAPYASSNRWLTCLTIDPVAFGATREDVRLYLTSQQIESRPVWKPMHLQPVFKGCPMRGGAVSEDLFERGICLPSGSNLSRDDLERVVEAVRYVYEKGPPSSTHSF